MSEVIYQACPAFACRAPSRCFLSLRQARDYCEQAAALWNVSYSLWAVQDGRLRLVERFAAVPQTAA